MNSTGRTPPGAFPFGRQRRAVEIENGDTGSPGIARTAELDQHHAIAQAPDEIGTKILLGAR